MLRIIKTSIADALFKCGWDLRRASNVPFGVRWYRDIRFFHNGSELSTVLDIGANIGQTALTIVRHFPKSRVYSFEPVPSTFEKLVRSTAQHPNIEPVRCALGSHSHTARMTSEPLSVSNRLSEVNPAAPNGQRFIEVDVDTVDSFCVNKRIEQVSLLKIDTEGHEMKVLQGTQRLLTEKRIDFILAECDFRRRVSQPHGDFVEILDFVSSYGFHLVSLYTGGVDDLGWVWGDVLFRQGQGAQPGRVASSPL